jgi:hypothetical protein
MDERPECVKHFAVNIAGLCLNFTAEEELSLVINERYRKFIAEDGTPDIDIKVHCGELPDLILDQKVYETRGNGGPWTLYRNGDNYIYTIHSSETEAAPYRIATFNTDFTRGDLYIKSAYSYGENDSDDMVCCNPIEYPFDEFIFIRKLSENQGVQLHACGITIDNKGILFSGISGAGKSTIAEVWKKKDVDILSDDRIVVRNIDEELIMYGTPWHGDAGISLPDKAPLKAIYFLEKSKDNTIIPLDVKDSAFRLAVRCFPTYYSKQGMEYILGIIAAIAQNTPSYEFRFTPDERAAETVINHVRSLA